MVSSSATTTTSLTKEAATPPLQWCDVFSKEVVSEDLLPLTPLLDEIKLCLQIPKQIIDEAIFRGKWCLLGQFLGARPNIDIIREWVWKKWATKGWVEVIAIPNEFTMFGFCNEEDRYLILSCDPKFFGKRGLFLKKWQLDFNPATSQFYLVPIWANLPNLPFELYHQKVIECSISKLVTIDLVTKAFTRLLTAWFCVQVNFEKPLPK